MLVLWCWSEPCILLGNRVYRCLLHILCSFKNMSFDVYIDFVWFTITSMIVLNCSRELRGFGFVKFRYPEDAAVAKQELNHQVIGGREISIVFAEENRKTPQEMRMRTRTRCLIFYILPTSRLGIWNIYDSSDWNLM